MKFMPSFCTVPCKWSDYLGFFLLLSLNDTWLSNGKSYQLIDVAMVIYDTKIVCDYGEID